MGTAIDELYAVLGWKLEGEQNLTRFQKGLDNATKSISVLGVAAGTFIGNLATQAFSKLGSAIGSLPGDVIGISAKFETFQATLETVEGSSDKARAALDWISDFAKRTPYEVEELTAAFVKLRAYGLDPTNGLMEDLGNASSAMGKTLNEAVEMIADAGTNSFERMKEFGITASQAGDKVTFSWDENGKTVTKTVKKTGEEIRKFVQETLGKRFSGAMLRQSKTWEGMMSNLADTWTDFQRRIGDGGFFETVKNKLAGVLDYLGRLDADGTLDRWSKSLSSAFTWAADTIGRLAVTLGRDLGSIGELLNKYKGAWEWLKWVVGAIAVRLFPMTTLLVGAYLALNELLTYMRGGKSVIGDFLESLEGLTGIDADKISEIVGTLGGMAGLALAAGGVALFAMSLSPLTKALLLFAGAYTAAKAGLEFLSSQDIMGDNKKATDNPRTKPGYIEQTGEVLYMDGNRIVDRPAENPTAGFTKDALDWKFKMQNLEGNLAKMNGAAQTVINDNADRSINVKATASVSVTEVNQAASAAGRETENAVRNALTSKPRLLNKGMY